MRPRILCTLYGRANYQKERYPGLYGTRDCMRHNFEQIKVGKMLYRHSMALDCLFTWPSFRLPHRTRECLYCHLERLHRAQTTPTSAQAEMCTVQNSLFPSPSSSSSSSSSSCSVVIVLGLSQLSLQPFPLPLPSMRKKAAWRTRRVWMRCSLTVKVSALVASLVCPLSRSV